MSTTQRAQRSLQQLELHRLSTSGWLRAAVLGANDGILSTSSLVLGVAAAHVAQAGGAETGSHGGILIAGVAGLVSGAMAMAAGEYVSVHSQADIEAADLTVERAELRADVAGERAELAAIYVGRGLDQALAEQVALALMAHDAIGAHARDELGLSENLRARPVQAAFSSAASFATGALVPLLVAAFTPEAALMWSVSLSALLSLVVLGAAAARVGGAPLLPAMLRVVFWGALAMGITTGVGALFGAAL
jgi:VIT1/CCC1 family predicted Fe2+/Mn2+ transporter